MISPICIHFMHIIQRMHKKEFLETNISTEKVRRSLLIKKTVKICLYVTVMLTAVEFEAENICCFTHIY
jgi:hypothetical protein